MEHVPSVIASDVAVARRGDVSLMVVVRVFKAGCAPEVSSGPNLNLGPSHSIVQGSDSQFYAACKTGQYMSTMAKSVMVSCMMRSCRPTQPPNHGNLAGGASSSAGSSAASSATNAGDFLQLAAGFGGGANC